MTDAGPTTPPPVPPSPPSPTDAPALPQHRPLSTAAVLSVVFAFIGPCTLGVVSLAGVVMGVVGIRQTVGGERARARGLPLAIAGLALSIVLPALFYGAYYLLMIETRRSFAGTVTRSNLTMVGFALHSYATDHDGLLPAADQWIDVVRQQDDGDALLSPTFGDEQGRIFAMNRALAGRNLHDLPNPGMTVLVFECRPGSPPTGDARLLPPQPRSDRGYYVLFADGHVRAVPPDQVGDCIWQPTAPSPSASSVPNGP